MKHSGHGDYASGDVAKTGDNRLCMVLLSFKSNLKLIYSIKMQTWVYTNGVWFPTSIVWPVEYSI